MLKPKIDGARLRERVRSAEMGGGAARKGGKEPLRQALAVLQHEDRPFRGVFHHGGPHIIFSGGGQCRRQGMKESISGLLAARCIFWSRVQILARRDSPMARCSASGARMLKSSPGNLGGAVLGCGYTVPLKPAQVLRGRFKNCSNGGDGRIPAKVAG